MAVAIRVMCEHSELIDPKTLIDHPRNAHTHPIRQIKALARSIETFGWRHPIVVSRRSGAIVAGHARKLAAIKLNTNAPVDYQDFETEEEELAVLTADNLIPEMANFDFEVLELNKITLGDFGFDLETIGFDFESKLTEQKEIDYKRKLVLEIECNSEQQQQQLFEQLTGDGFKCRVLKL